MGHCKVEENRIEQVDKTSEATRWAVTHASAPLWFHIEQNKMTE